ncbi:MAG: hypothetical protein ACKVQA_06860 [Burkholderiales bacterium]
MTITNIKNGRVWTLQPMADGRFEVRDERGELRWRDSMWAIRIMFGGGLESQPSPSVSK